MKRIELNIQRFAAGVNITGSDGNINIVSNTSYINGTISISTTGSTYNNSGTAYYTINGGSPNYFNIGRNSTVSFPYTTGPYYHGNDGSLNPQTISVYVHVTSTTSTSGSINVNMIKIPRNATITSADNFNDEQNPKITYSNPAGNAVNKLEACISLTGEKADVPYRDISKTGNSYTFELTEEERNTLRESCINSISRKVIFFVRTTIDGTVFHSTSERTLSIVNANPTFNNFDFKDINSKTVALTGNNKYNINGYSNQLIEITSTNKATAKKYATMSKYRVSIGQNASVDVTYSDSQTVSAQINGATTGTINTYAIDSRGNSTLVTKLATKEINYTDISIDALNCKVERDNGGVGKNVTLTYKGNAWYGSFGAKNNSIKTATYQLKKTTSNEWITGTTNIKPTFNNDGTFEFSGLIASDNPDTSWDIQSSYDIKISITDELSIAETLLTPLASAIPNISLAHDGVGIMCDYDEQLGGLLQVGGKILDGGKLLWKNNNPSVEFGVKDITLNSDDYDLLEIYYYDYTNTKYMLSTRAFKGEKFILQSIFQYQDTGFVGSRFINYVNDTTLSVRNNVTVIMEQSFRRTANNLWNIPVYIIGYKTKIVE